MNMDDSVLEKLLEVRALIEEPEHWTQGSFAKDASGKHTNAMSPTATCWCLIGALRKVTGGDSSNPQSINTFVALTNVTEGTSISLFNDTHTHDEIISVIDAAIAYETGNKNERL
jgi:hypothetical protein